MQLHQASSVAQILAAMSLLCASQLAAQSPPAGFTYEMLVDGPLSSGTAMAFTPDGRLLVTERETGNIRVYQNGALSPTPWANVPTNGGGPWAEEGLVGIAVDPNFLNNRYVYVYYSDPSGSQSRIGRLQENGGFGTNLTVLSPNGALPSQLYHVGGPLVFGTDGTLFVATGDGFSSVDAQNTSSWLGKVLRFNVPNLTVPANNPFPGNPVYSYGHRNQFGLAIHPVNGGLYQTENGEALKDELNRIVPGGNYGWPQVEGNAVPPNPSFVEPIAWYQPTMAPTGCAFYWGSNYPASYKGVWFVAEYNQNRIRALTLDASGQQVVSQTIFDQPPGSGYGFVMGPDGNLWFLTNDTGGYGADELGRYVHQNEPVPSAHLMAVSNRSLGGAVTVGVHAHNGNLVVPWLSLTRFTSPVPTPFGNLWTTPDAMLPTSLVTGDNRVYAGVSVPNNPSFLGVSLYAQALVLDATGAFSMTNFSEHVLKG